MKADYIETYGVFLGFVRPCMGGWLMQPNGRTLTWGWMYEGAEEALSRLIAQEAPRCHS